MNIAQKGLRMLSRGVKSIGGIFQRAWNALRWQRTARDNEAFLESVRESGGRALPVAADPVRKPEENEAAKKAREQAKRVMFQEVEMLTREIRRHHDPQVQFNWIGNTCHMFLRSDRRGYFGGITLSSNFFLSWRLRSTKPIPLRMSEEVWKLLAAENCCHHRGRWHIAAETGEIFFAGDIQLYRDPLRDLQLVRQGLFRRMEVLSKRMARLIREKAVQSNQGKKRLESVSKPFSGSSTTA